VTARLSRLVTCESAPSATCNSPTPSVALVCDWVRACWLACKPLTSERPAASSAPELIFEPEDNSCSVFDRLLLVLFRLFSAYTAERLFKTPRDMGFSLSMRGFADQLRRCPHFLSNPGLLSSVRLPSHLAPSSAWELWTLRTPLLCPALDT